MNRKQRRAQAKLNRKSQSSISHIRHKQNGGELVNFYWGYNADKPYTESFELSNIHLINGGLSDEYALKVGKQIKQASDYQLEVLINRRTEEVFGLTREEFIAEEWQRLHSVIHNISLHTGTVTLAEALQDYMIGCCAISTLVAAGEIPQDNYNGDKFGYAFNSVEQAFA